MRLKPLTEAAIQKLILSWLRLHGAWAVRVNSGAARVGKRLVRFTDTVGTPDILCCVGGRLVGIEVKRPGGRLRPAQGEVLDAIRRAGGLAFVARSVDDVEQALRAEGLL